MRIYLFALLVTCSLASSSLGEDTRPPNIIHIVGDDVGYDDLSCYGAPKIKTPNLDKLASQGVRFTSFYAPSPTCTPTRAALMTGCYAERVGVNRVLFPHDKIGLHPSEVTIAELLKGKGYATACIGKWHLGHLPPHLPTKHGFDVFFGIPYPNDHGPERKSLGGANVSAKVPPIPLFRNDEVIERGPNLAELPDRFTAEAVKFIGEHKDKPFFLHLSNIETHTPWYVPKRFEGKSADGPFGDAVEYMDWAVGEVLRAVADNGLEQNTLIVFTTDNGPLWNRHKELEEVYGKFGTVDTTRPHLLKGGKYQSRLEGGTRVPAILRWPGQIPAGGTRDGLCAGFDLFTTFAKVAGADVPADRIIDGKDLRPLMTGVSDKSLPRSFYYYQRDALLAVRHGDWKLTLAAGPNQKADKLELYDVKNDPGETKDLAAEKPEVVKELEAIAEKARQDLGDSRKGVEGKNRRPAAVASD
ncbi:MAG: sulfatase [Planctomycetota bacterium]|nr:sulfatase [Planctomycetota bacterium]